jgi:hypothetical protein
VSERNVVGVQSTAIALRAVLVLAPVIAFEDLAGVRQAVMPEVGRGFLRASRSAIGWLDSLWPGALRDAAPLLLD